MNVTRRNAAKLIDRLREYVSALDPADLGGEYLYDLLVDAGIPRQQIRFAKCTGEAHSNPHIDHCPRCAPRWGWDGPAATVR